MIDAVEHRLKGFLCVSSPSSNVFCLQIPIDSKCDYYPPYRWLSSGGGGRRMERGRGMNGVVDAPPLTFFRILQLRIP